MTRAGGLGVSTQSRTQEQILPKMIKRLTNLCYSPLNQYYLIHEISQNLLHADFC